MCIPILSPHNVTLHCYLSLYCTHGWLVGWFVSCYRTPLNTTLLLSALTIGICLVSHSLAGTFKSTPSLSLSIPNIYYETSLYNSLHLIVYSTYIQMSSVSCQISFVGCAALLACLSNTQLCSCMYLRTKCCHLLCHSVLT